MGNGAVWTGVAFWMFVAACVVAGTWEKIRRNAERHETFRRILEKTGTVDEAKLQELFNSSRLSSPASSMPGGGYRVLRITGTILMILGAGMGAFFLIVGPIFHMPDEARAGSLVFSFAGLLIGFALFFASRFAQPPPDRGNGRTAG